MLRHFRRKGMARDFRPVMLSKVRQRRIYLFAGPLFVAVCIIIGLVVGIPAKNLPKKQNLCMKVIVHHSQKKKSEKSILPKPEKHIFEAQKMHKNHRKIKPNPLKHRILRHKRAKKHKKTKRIIVPGFGLNAASTTKGKSSIEAPVGDTLMKSPQKVNKRKAKQEEVQQPESNHIYGNDQVDQPPKFIFRAMPKYPPEAEADGLEGTVIVWVIVDAKGRPVKVEKIEGPDRILNLAAKQAVIQSRFSPAIYHGMPVMCRIQVPYRFRLE